MSFQAYIDAVKAKTGKTPDELFAEAQKSGIINTDMKARELCDWLAETYGLGHGHSMAIWNVFVTSGWVETKHSKMSKKEK